MLSMVLAYHIEWSTILWMLQMWQRILNLPEPIKADLVFVISEFCLIFMSTNIEPAI